MNDGCLSSRGARVTTGSALRAIAGRREAAFDVLREGLSSRDRIDPYWDVPWQGAKGRWSNWAHQVGPGSEAAAHALLTDPLTLVKVLGALHGWRTTTVPQLATITGLNEILEPGNTLLRQMAVAGLVEIGTSSHFPADIRDPQDVELVRNANNPSYERVIKPALTPAEAVGVTGPAPGLAVSRGHDRHDVLAAELALRLAEHLPTGTVMGEPFSKVRGLVDPYREASDPEKWLQKLASVADLTFIRPDGYRVAVEITASLSGKSFSEKVRRWARAIATVMVHDHRDPRLSVVFVVAPNPLARTGAPVKLHGQVRHQIRTVLNESGLWRHRLVAERFAVARWRDWFPKPGGWSDHFASLSAHIPPPYDGNFLEGDWRETNLAHAVPDGGGRQPLRDLSDALDQSGLLGQTPHWIRRRTSPPFLEGLTPTQVLNPKLWAQLVSPLPADDAVILGDRPDWDDPAPVPPRLLGLGVETRYPPLTDTSGLPWFTYEP